MVGKRNCKEREAVAHVSVAGCARARTAARVCASGADSRRGTSRHVEPPRGKHAPLKLGVRRTHLWLAALLGRRTGWGWRGEEAGVREPGAALSLLPLRYGRWYLLVGGTQASYFAHKHIGALA